MAYVLKLKHGQGHRNAYVNVTADSPLCHVPSDEQKDYCMASGFFELVGGSECGVEVSAAAPADEDTPLGDELKVSDMQAEIAVAGENVTGTLKYVHCEAFGGDMAGNILAVKLDRDLHSELTVTLKTAADSAPLPQGKKPYIICEDGTLLLLVSTKACYKLESVTLSCANEATGESDETTLTLTGLTLERPVGADAVRICTSADDQIYEGVNVDDLIFSNVAIAWEGTTGTLSGHVHFYEFTNGVFGGDSATGHYVPFAVEGYKDKSVTITGSDGGTKDMDVGDTHLIDRVDNYITAGKDLTFSCEGQTIATIKFGPKLMLTPPMAAQVFTVPDGGETVAEKKVSDYVSNIRVTATSDRDVSIAATFHKKEGDKYIFPLRLNKYYADKSVSMTGIKKVESTDLWVDVPSAPNGYLMVRYSGTIVARLHFDQSTFE